MSIPIYYHIPKCGGTYFMTKLKSAIRQKYQCPIVSIVDNNDYIYARFLTANNEYINGEENQLNKLDLDFFLSDNFTVFKDILVFIIEPQGFRIADNILNKFNNIAIEEYSTIRHPYTRIQSLFNYLNSDVSKHEATHVKFKNQNIKSFSDYIHHPFFEDCWIDKQILGRPINNNNEFVYVLNKLSKIVFFETKDIDQLIIKIIKQNLHDLNLSLDIDKLYGYKNSTDTQKIPFRMLNKDTQELFLQKCYWDIKIYQQLIRKTNANIS